jgi:hypothetical protein
MRAETDTQGIAPRPARATRKSTRRSPGERLRSAVELLAGPEGRVIAHAERAWASITFAGTRHRMTLTFAGLDGWAAAEVLIEALPDHEFTVPGHLVADAAVVAIDQRLLPNPLMIMEIDLLLLQDG